MLDNFFGAVATVAAAALMALAAVYAARRRAKPSPLMELEKIVKGVSEENERLRIRQAEMQSEIEALQTRSDEANKRLTDCYEEIQRRQKEHDDQIARLYQRLGEQK